MLKSLFKMLLPLVATYFIDRYSKTGKIPTPKGLDKIFGRNRNSVDATSEDSATRERSTRNKNQTK